MSKCLNFSKPCNFKDTFFKTDAISLVDVANSFVGEKARKKQLFGKFLTNDDPVKVSLLTKSTHRGIVNSVSIYLT